MEQNHLCNFGRGTIYHYFEVFDEEMLFKDIYGGYFVQHGEAIRAIVVMGVMMNIFGKLL